MARTELSPQRLTETKKTNIGRIIIFCEVKTGKYYFDYFAEIIKKNKYTAVEVVLETANGNAQTVLSNADSFMSDEEHNRRFSTYVKYLAFDCDNPPNVQAVIQAAKPSKREIYRRLSEHLHSSYSKGHKGKTCIEKAIDNAKALEQQYTKNGKSVFTSIKEMNPYTSVHRLIEQFMVEISG